MDIPTCQYYSQEGYYGNKDDYYDSNGNCYNSICSNKSYNIEKKFNISQEKQDELRKEIKKYFEEEIGEYVGDIACNMLLDFFMEKIAPDFYNQGIKDAYKYIIDRLEALLDIQK